MKKTFDYTTAQPVIEISDFHLGFESQVDGKVKQILRNINLKIYQGEKLAIIGESGSGKTVLSTAISCLLGKDAIRRGSIKLEGIEINNLKERDINKKKIRGSQISYVFQNSLQTMNPYLKIGAQLIETLIKKKVLKTRNACKKKVLDVLKSLNLSNPEKIYNSYPHELSGGMIQRVVIACSLLLQPKVLILDEPTSALDAVVELQIIELLDEIAKQGTTIILISHDLNLVSSFSDRVAVMYAGKVVEIGINREINLFPQHPYTWGLLMSIPSYGRELYSIPGRVPSDLSKVAGDAFALRNLDFAMEIDFELEPFLYRISPTHYAATWLLSKHAPSYTPPLEIAKRWEQFHSEIVFEEKSDQIEISDKFAKAKLVLDIENLNITYVGQKVISKVVDSVDLRVREGEIVGLIGESGSGKSTIAKAIAGMIDFSATKLKMNGIESPRFANKIFGNIRTRYARTIQMIYQNPAASLNDYKPIWKSVGEVLFSHPEFLKKSIRNLYDQQALVQQTINDTDWYKQIESINYHQNHLIFLRQSITSAKNLVLSQINQYKQNALKALFLKISIEKSDGWLRFLPARLKWLGFKEYRNELKKICLDNDQFATKMQLNLKHQIQVFSKKICLEKVILSAEKAKLFKFQKTSKTNHYLKSKLQFYKQVNKDLLLAKWKMKSMRSSVIKSFVLNALKQVGLDESHMKMYPWQLSGGQQQRVAIARSLMPKPKILIADEPIASLDVSLQADIIRLIRDLTKQNQMSALFISHDLEMLAQIADRVYVLHKGRVVETGHALEIFLNPIHPYTKMLVSSSQNKGFGKKLEKVFVYQPHEHDVFHEHLERSLKQINSNHFVYANKFELNRWLGTKKD